jgi:NTE family protein
VPEVGTLARVATSFDRFERGLCRDLVHAGWWLAGASIATYHPHMLQEAGTPPVWREPW